LAQKADVFNSRSLVYYLSMVEVIPSILEKEFKEIERKVKTVEGLVEWVQIDIADGVLVPNKTFYDPQAYKKLPGSIKLEGHLMVADPVAYIKPLTDAGFKRLYAHIEAGKSEEFIDEVYKFDCQVGLAIDGPTKIEKIMPFLDNIDAVLVMTIDAGFSGRPFREDTLAKIRKIREAFFDLPIGTDGAMNDVNAAKTVAAGANIICSNSYIFSSADIKERIRKLKNLI